MSILDLQQLRYFLEIARTENITKAAENIHVAQPALSACIARLENELETKLFSRVGRSIRLNDNGRLLVQRSQMALAVLDNVKRELQDMQESTQSVIHLQVLVGSGILPGFLSYFRSRHPGVGFQLAQVKQGDSSDMCLTSVVNGVMPESSRLLLEEEILLAVPADHPLASRQSITLSQVQDDSFLSLDISKPLRQATDTFCLAAGFSPRIVMETDSPATLRGLISAGLGVAFIPSVTWREVRDAANVRLLRISRPYCQRKLVITWEQKRYLSKVEHLFLNEAQQYCTALKLESAPYNS